MAEQKSFGTADAAAFGGGFGTGMAWTKTGAEVGGGVSKYHSAPEIGSSSGTFATAGNSSIATYYGVANDADCDRGGLLWGSKSSVDLNGFAYTKGDSSVKVDPTGNFQSATGSTSNMAKAGVEGADYKNTYVAGNGGVNTGANVGNAWSQGVSTFGYEGSTFGKGGADHTSYAQKYSTCDTNSARSGSSGSAYSFSVGMPNVK